MKGTLQPTEKITVEIPTLYGGTHTRTENKGVPEGKRALLFLERKEPLFSPLLGPYNPVLGGVKVVLESGVHCYVQHGNPGPLHLTLMVPENFRIADSESYDEALLLEDLEIALEKAKHLERPIVTDCKYALRRLPGKSALPFEMRTDPFIVLGASIVIPFVLVGLWRYFLTSKGRENGRA
ncbi:MAG: hypothetical protein ACI9R3_005292 [Verrucomicrobiales bacterium]|jgi:hypothetical protein